MNESAVYRTRSSKVLTVATGAMSVFALAYFAVEGGALEVVRSGPLMLLAAALVWAIFGNPRLELSDGGITVVNVARTVHVPWPLYQGVETQWSLRILTREGAVDSWAIPAPSGYAARVTGTAGRLPHEVDAAARQPERHALGRVDAVSVSYAIAQRHAALAAAGYLDDAPVERIRLARSWNTVPLALPGGALVLSALAVLL